MWRKAVAMCARVRRRTFLAGFLALAALPLPAWGQWLVEDVNVGVQTTLTAIQSVMTAANTAAMYVRQGEQIINEYNVILNQIKQYETMVKNLARLPEGLNFFDTISAWGTTLTGLLGQANAIGYTLSNYSGPKIVAPQGPFRL
jgi:P-type conjugative transfer protein TrbJ